MYPLCMLLVVPPSPGGELVYAGFKVFEKNPDHKWEAF